jgi:hypothetical protein
LTNTTNGVPGGEKEVNPRPGWFDLNSTPASARPQ